jgi:hypothetical protein
MDQSIGNNNITPPPELVRQWVAQIWHEGTPVRVALSDEHIATRAAQWGADQELEACLRLVEIDAGEDAYDFARYIRAARRPKPLKLTPEQAQQVRDLLAPNSKPTPNSSQIGRSLVDRVALAISGIEYGLERDEEAVNWASEARAAICEVAAWLIDRRRDDDWLAPFEELADLLLEEAQR